MTGHDIEGLKLRLAMPFALSGNVVVEIPQGAPSLPVPRIFLISHAGRNQRQMEIPSIGRMDRRADSDEEGRFVLADVYPGVYRIEVEDLPPAPYYLDEIWVGNAEIGSQEVNFAGPLSIEVDYKTNGGSVRGEVTGHGSCGVWLVPQDVFRQGRNFLRFSLCDKSGHYQMNAVRPGDYYAIAFTGDELPWYMAIDANLQRRATSVTVIAGETVSADLRVIAP